jgi:hypothetical protein
VVDVAKAFDLEDTWAGKAPELVDKRFADEALIYPLAQRVGGEWGAEVAHLPEIPVGEIGAATAAPAAAQEERHPSGHRHGVSETTTPETPAGKPPEGAAAKPEGEKYLLFRFMDFTAEAGKRYRYRVQLVMNNPNHNIETRYLLDAALAKKKLLETRWSDPSEAVVVPRDDQLLVKDVKAPPRVSDQPSAALVLLKFKADDGQQFFAESPPVNRGQLINFPNHLAHPVTPAATAAPDVPPPTLDLDHAAEAAPARPGHVKPPEGPRISFNTGMILLDVRGGERQPGHEATKEPAEMLFLDVDGSLVARDETSDEEGVQRIMGLKPPPVAKPRKPEKPRPTALDTPGGATPRRGRTRAERAATPNP